MICYVLYQKNSESERPASELVAELEARQVDARLIEADSAEGTQLSERHDLLSRPAAVLVQSDGIEIQSWQHALPTPADVAYLAHA